MPAKKTATKVDTNPDFEKQIGELVPLLSQIANAIKTNADFPAPLVTQLSNVQRKLDADMQTANRQANKRDVMLEKIDNLNTVLEDLIAVAQKPLSSFSSMADRY